MVHATRRSPPRSPPGFTLIELMIVVTIIGLLASVAIPEFTKFSQRAKASEREVTVSAIVRTLNDHWINKGTFPGGSDTLNMPPNPPYVSGQVTGGRKPYVESLAPWAELNWRPHGTLYFHYSLQGVASMGMLTITAETDLDNDGAPSATVYTYRLEEGIWQLEGVPQTFFDDF